MEEEANLILTASVIDNRTSGQAVKGVGTILSELKADGKIEDYDTPENADITNIKFDVSSITLGAGDNEELTATFESGSDNGGYYAQIKGKKYPVSKVNAKIEIGKTEITTSGNSKREIASVETSNSAVATVQILENEKDKVKITGVSKGTAEISVKYTEEIKTTITVTIKEYVTVVVNVQKDASNNDLGTVSIMPNNTNNKYEKGTQISLQATAKNGYQFEGWYEGTSKLSDAKLYDYIVPESNVTIIAKFEIKLKYGATVQIGTVTVNGTELKQGWKFFYEDADTVTNPRIYLIYANYLENAQIPTKSYVTKNGYNVYATYKPLDNLMNYLKGETETFSTTWNGLATGVENALNAKLSEGEKLSAGTVKAYGAPTIEQFRESYNENYPEEQFEINYKVDTSNGSIGYVYKKKNEDWNTSKYLGGQNKLLYFSVTSAIKEENVNPVQTKDTLGYWLVR